jgi:F-type H+-transporting ATPase subunit delta
LSKGLVRHIPAVAREAEKLFEAENGILTITVDFAFPPDGKDGAAFSGRLAAAVKEKTGSREVRVNTRLMPELIGGCRLYIGSECLDASLRGQLHKMAADLSAAGGNAW